MLENAEMLKGSRSRLTSTTITRRQFLGATVIAAGSAPFLLCGGGTRADEPKRRPRVAAIFTVCEHRSHAHVILENFLTPFLFNGKLMQPAADVDAERPDVRSPRGAWDRVA